jgi:carbon storage regulator
MLVLSRQKFQKIRIGDDITIVVTGMSATTVRLGIDAPPSLKILREELFPPTTPECKDDDISNSARPSSRPDAPHGEMV